MRATIASGSERGKRLFVAVVRLEVIVTFRTDDAMTVGRKGSTAIVAIGYYDAGLFE